MFREKGWTVRVADLDMPEETLRAFPDHGRVEPRLEIDLHQAQYVFNQLDAAGVDYDVVATLEPEGIEMFIASLDRLLDQICAKRRGLTAGA